MKYCLWKYMAFALCQRQWVEMLLSLWLLVNRTELLERFSFFLPEIMETSDEQVNEAQPRSGLRLSPESVRQEKALCEMPGTSRTSTRGSLRFGSLSHHSFFSRHNPHPHRVRHMQGEPLRIHRPASACMFKNTFMLAFVKKLSEICSGQDQTLLLIIITWLFTQLQEINRLKS